MQDRPMDFNVTKTKNQYGFRFHIATILYETTFTKLPLAKFWCNFKDKYTQLLAKAIKTLLFYSNLHLLEAKFFHSSTKATGRMQEK